MQTTDSSVDTKAMAGARPAVYVLTAWTLFMWTTRLRLIFTEDDLSLGDIVWRIVPVVVFVALALLLVISLRTGKPDLSRLVAAAALWTTAYWLIRVGVITFHDHSIGFKVVHAVLAVVSITTAAWAWRRTSR